MKKGFNEREIEELSDLYYIRGFEQATHEAITYLTDVMGIAKHHKIVMDLRMNLNKRSVELHRKLETDFPNSTLTNTLMERISE